MNEVQLRKELKRAVNELCLKCGDYRREHEGSCDWCHWKEIRHDAGRDQDV